MEKYLVTIEFRYKDVIDNRVSYETKIVTVGVYDTFDDAILHGNSAMTEFEERFKIHTYPDGREATRERFGKTNGPFGTKTNLISNSAYLKVPFDFYVKIETLHYKSVGVAINEVIDAVKRYKTYKLKSKD